MIRVTQTSFAIRPEQKQTLEEIAVKKNATLSEIVREALDMYFKKNRSKLAL